MVDAAQQVARLADGGVFAREGGEVGMDTVLFFRTDGALFREAAQERERGAACPAGLLVQRVGQDAASLARRAPELLHQRPFRLGQINVPWHKVSPLFTFVTRA